MMQAYRSVLFSKFSLSFNRLRPWGARLGYTIADQGLLSGANLLLSLLLAKWVSPAEYGVFAISFAVFLFVAGFHNALIVDPFVVFGPSKYQHQTRKYVTLAVYIHLIFSLIVALLFAVTSRFILGHYTGVSLSMLVSLTIGNFAILLFWLIRRAAYLESNTALACFGSLCYMITLLGSAWWFARQDWITAASAYWLMSAASLVASGVLWWRLRLGWREQQQAPEEPLDLRQVLADHWQYGRWIMAASLAFSIGSLAYLPMVGVFSGLAASGVLKAMQNLVQPLQQIVLALSVFLVPWLSRQRQARGDYYPLSVLPQMLGAFCALGVVSLTLLIFLGPLLIERIYGSDYYSASYWVLYGVAAATLVQMAIYACATTLRALEDSNAIFLSQLSGAIFVLTFGIYLSWHWQLPGALVSLVCSSVCELLVIYWCIQRQKRRSRAG